MNTRAISTSVAVSACDICGRTLLRGERAETYVSSGGRHTVCELCTTRALQGGWLREGELPDYGDAGTRVDRRRSLLSRLRSRREAAPEAASVAPEHGLYDDPHEPLELPVEPPPPPPRRAAPAPQNGRPASAPAPVRAEASARPAARERSWEPRHVRAVPTSTEHKVASAIESFNGSEHPRTVAGISRSLGVPEVAVLPASPQSGMVSIVVAWELCWYRYELDLGDEVPTVQVVTQGYELTELEPAQRRVNALADKQGLLTLAA
ncbi:MAG: hypothetical protein M3016_08940 [Actinomycetota bacterium]|nr:hypothetical protein [Actinomycetota bacterium]